MRAVWIAMVTCALSGCGLFTLSEAQKKALQDDQRFEKAVEALIFEAEQAQIIEAARAAFKADDLALQEPKSKGPILIIDGVPDVPGWASVLHAGLKAAGSTDDYGPEEGCRIEVLTDAAGMRARATCYKLVEEPTFGNQKKTPKKTRVETRDPYLVLRLIEHIDSKTATGIWAIEPTGHRTQRCAKESRSFMSIGCPKPAARGEALKK